MKTKLINGNCEIELYSLPKNSIDLVVTSPPYDNLRTYEGKSDFNFKNFQEIAVALKRCLKDGGVIVWVVGDATIKGSETLTSFRQVLFFKSIGLNVHDTMIYYKDSFAFPSKTRCHQVFEYMFVISNGKPNVFNRIFDVKNKHRGRKDKTNSQRKKDGGILTVTSSKEKIIKDYGSRANVWHYSAGYMKGQKDKIAYQHPATFPESLARDHIISWSNPGDWVLDPMMGSGTTGKMAKQLKRNFVGIEINKNYYDIAKKRIEG